MQGCVQNDLRKETWGIERTVTRTIALKKMFVDCANGFDGNVLKVIWPERTLACADLRTMKKLIQDIDMAISYEILFFRQIVTEQVTIEILTKLFEKSIKQCLCQRYRLYLQNVA